MSVCFQFCLGETLPATGRVGQNRGGLVAALRQFEDGSGGKGAERGGGHLPNESWRQPDVSADEQKNEASTSIGQPTSTSLRRGDYGNKFPHSAISTTLLSIQVGSSDQGWGLGRVQRDPGLLADGQSHRWSESPGRRPADRPGERHRSARWLDGRWRGPLDRHVFGSFDRRGHFA
jgi:hypothetical protein